MVNNEIRHIELTPFNQEWLHLYLAAAQEIQAILQNNCLEIHHIGSTAIPNIYAKPVIDLMPVVKDITQVDQLNSQFEKLGFIGLGEYGIPGRRFFWKSREKRTHHVHIFQQGAKEIARHLAFKNFLLKHPDYAEAYSILKCALAEVFPTDIDNYIYGKSSFIQMIDYKTQTAPENQLTAEDNILIESYNPAWPKLALAEIKAIRRITQALAPVAIEHIGSTAVPDLASKPVIDIFISVKTIAEAMQWIVPLETLGYQFWDENPDKMYLRFFKGMPPFGKQRTHHVHIVEEKSHILQTRALFRDILRRDQQIRQDYEDLKMKLAKTYLTDREAYTHGKTQFIESILRENN